MQLHRPLRSTARERRGRQRWQMISPRGLSAFTVAAGRLGFDAVLVASGLEAWEVQDPPRGDPQQRRTEPGTAVAGLTMTAG